MKPVPLEVTMMKRIGELNAENARLKAEVERQSHHINYLTIEANTDHARWLRCLEDLEKLRASSFVTAVPCEQYDRVVKAGEDLLTWVLILRHYSPSDIEDMRLVILKWNAAKEGKQP